MNPERWARIKEIYHSALEIEPGRREAYLKEACAGDEALFTEVACLLADKGNSEELFDSPALNAVARALAEDDAHKPRPNLIGQTLLHYRIEKKIGEGGMGEVFLAQDTFLNRKVALKFLPPEMQQDATAHKRFLREARLAAALDHPFICHINEVAEIECKDFIVMEYVDGQTLMEKTQRGKLPLNQALQVATEVAEALQAAHGKGIVHRDLKPSNIMLTEAGHAKVMDFGLAKQVVLPGGVGDRSQSVSAVTRSGMTLGTLAYMSPEQVRGEEIDARSDIFSFGLVLYEMLTEVHPFRKGSPMETASAILHEEPKRIHAIAKVIPADIEKLVDRCLRKEAFRRFQDMNGVKLALENIRRDQDARQLQETLATSTKRIFFRLRTAIFAVVVPIVLAVTTWYWLTRTQSSEKERELIAIPLTSYPGFELTPSFSPDGNSVAFTWCKDGPGTNCHIYIKQIDREPPSPLTAGAREDFSPAWSPDGRLIAFLRQLSTTSVELMIVPQRGGLERVLGKYDHWACGAAELKSFSYLAWSPDSKGLVISSSEDLSLLNIETRERRNLPRRDLVYTPVLSPDGRALAFWGYPFGLYLLRLGENYLPQGEPVIVSKGSGPTWMSDGSALLFVLRDGLWRMPASGSKESHRLAVSFNNADSPVVSRQGNRLAYCVWQMNANIWRVDLKGVDLKPGRPVPITSSTKIDSFPAFSPDCKRIAFSSNRSGATGIWLADSDGSKPIRLLSGGAGPRWSPDGRSIAFFRNLDGNADVWVVDTTGGAPRRLTTDPGPDKWPWWSRDGRSIYFQSSRSGSAQIWRMTATGEDAVQITPNGDPRDVPEESPDAKFIYYQKGWPGKLSVWRMPVDGGEETRVIEPVHIYGQWSVCDRGIFFLKPDDETGRSEMCLYDFDTGGISKIMTIDRPVYFYVAASRDGRSLLYAQFDQGGSDLMLVENFH